MKRELKFRVWYPEKWTDDDQPIFAMTYDWAFEDYSPLNDLLANPGENVTFMQFTGLRDKNENLIYEYDILSFNGNVIEDSIFPINTFTYDEHCTHVVEWDSKLSGWTPKFIDNTDPKYRRDTRRLMLEGKCEVIGNLYEHPSLIKTE